MSDDEESVIDDVFGPGGLLARKFAGYVPRKGQLDMARAVELAINGGKHLIAEGPTGTGKGLSYLVPSIAKVAFPTGEKTHVPGRVIVVTANIALQEQLVTKDLPLLREVLPLNFSFALAKGRNNYLCVDQFGKTMAEMGITDGRQLSLGGGDPVLARLMTWAQETKTGDISEFPETPGGLWKKVSVGSEECKGTACKWHSKCFAEKAKQAAQRAHVVVTNYHLFFAHLLVRRKMRAIADAGGEVDPDIVLPPADIVVFDEAHKAADIARDFLGFQIAKTGIEWLVRGFNHELAQDTRLAADRFFAALAAHKKSFKYKSRLKKGHPLAPEGEALATLLQRVGKFYKDSISANAWSPDEKAELEMRGRRGFLLADQLRESMKPEETTETVYFVEETGRGDPVLKSKPIDVSGFLAEELFGQFGSVIVTSATLATGGGCDPFAFVRKEIGLPESDQLVAESPFRWGDQVLLVVPRTMCDPKDREAFPPAVARHVRGACELAGGRTLGLFTSFKCLEGAARECSSLPFRIFKQGEAPRNLLTQKFREDVTSVLLGCESFWAGVDCAGETLSCVIIDRLPFPTPDDPIVDAIAERDDRWFFTYAVPRAIIALKQGFGRLIRSETDRGVVVVLDRRLTTMSYGRSFLAALPKVLMSDELADVGKFLNGEEAIA